MMVMTMLLAGGGGGGWNKNINGDDGGGFGFGFGTGIRVVEGTSPTIIDCSSSCSSCAGDTITCPDGQDCAIYCIGTEACLGTEIVCPWGNNCNIHVAGDRALKDSNVYGNEAILHVTVEGGANACQDVEFDCTQTECLIEHNGGHDAFFESRIRAKEATKLTMVSTGSGGFSGGSRGSRGCCRYRWAAAHRRTGPFCAPRALR